MDDRLAEHIGKWLESQEFPSTVELRCRSEIIDSIVITKESEYQAMAVDLIESASNDAFSEGKTRTYQLVAITERGERTICPLSIRRRIDKTASDLVALLTKQNSELHQELRKKDKEFYEMTMQFARAVAADRDRLVEENSKNYALRSETLDKLESLRSKELDRKLAQDEADQKKEIKERIVDTGLPLFMAMTSKWLPGQVPTESKLAEMVKSLSESQLENLQVILDDQWPVCDELFTGVLSGRNVTKEFGEFAQALTIDKKQKVISILNVGQQALLQEMLQPNGASTHH